MTSRPLRRWLAALSLSLAATAPAEAGDLVVSAAASLTNAFRDIARAYEARHPGTRVALNVGASGALLQQIAKGAPVDVFASADQDTMQQAVRQGLVDGRHQRDFARNSLVVIVPADSAFVPRRLEDLADARIQRIALGQAASVPAGRYARLALDAARLRTPIEAKAIATQNVRQALDYVARGEVDAGFVYATDAALMADKVRLAFPVPLAEPIRYPIAPIAPVASGGAQAEQSEAARFIDYVMSPAGQAVLARYGFLSP